MISFQAVYYYVFCHPASPDTFEIATNFPKRVLSCAPQEGSHIQTLKEAGLRCREVLFVYDLEAWCSFANFYRKTAVVCSVSEQDCIQVTVRRWMHIASVCFQNFCFIFKTYFSQAPSFNYVVRNAENM